MSRSIFTISLILLLFGGASAGVIKVPQKYATIQAGIDASVKGDTVLVDAGTYYENISFKGKAITVASNFIAEGDTDYINSTIINGSRPSDPNKGSVVSFTSGEDTMSVICGFTITGGTGTLYSSDLRVGGGIFCNNSGGKITANNIINNTTTGPAAYGGGLATMPFFSGAYIVFKDNQIKDNKVTANSSMASGGGVWLLCNAKLSTNLISYNTCIGKASSIQAAAGGISCYTQMLYPREIIMENNTITYNSVHSYCNITGSVHPIAGGVIIAGFNGSMIKNDISHNEVWDYSNLGAEAIGVAVGDSPDSFIIEGNIIRENAVHQDTGNSYGGGMEVYGAGFISIINNIVEGNLVTHGGGVLIYNTSTVEIVNNTIINNRATYGGGIYIYDATGYIMNTIIWGNQASTNAGIHINTGTITAAYCDIQGRSDAMNIDADPLFVDASFQLSDNSPCIGKGITSFDFGGGVTCCCPATDKAGNLRPNPAGSNPDIGAFESPLATEVMNFAETKIPQSYFLAQNYPNPFNRSTTIEFALPKSAFVSLKVYNLLGEEVATLIAELRSAGVHKLNWDTRGLASGVYLYRLEAGKFVQSKKLILMR